MRSLRASLRALGNGSRANRQVVATTNARPQFRDIRAVHVKRNCQTVPPVRDRVDISGWGERHGGTSFVYRASNLDQRIDAVLRHDPVAGFKLTTAVDTNDAPRDMIVNRSRLTREPYETDDRKTAVGFYVEHVLPVSKWVGRALLGQQKIFRRKIPPQ